MAASTKNGEKNWKSALRIGDDVRTSKGETFSLIAELGSGTFGVAYRCMKIVEKGVDCDTLAVLKVQKDKEMCVHESRAMLYLQTSEKVLENMMMGGGSSSSQDASSSGDNTEEDIAEKHNLVKLLDTFCHGDLYCMLLESMPMNLEKLLECQPYKQFPFPQISCIAKQILTALRHMKERGMIHADLKLDNILVDPMHPTWRIKVADFGWAFFTSEMSNYQGVEMQSLPNRAPEIYAGAPFDEGIDMWSLGMMCGSMYFGYDARLFSPQHPLVTLHTWTRLCGNIPASVLDSGRHTLEYYHKDANGVYQLKDHAAHVWDVSAALYQVKIFKQSDLTDKPFSELFFGCLKMDPAERLTPTAALQLDFVQGNF